MENNKEYYTPDIEDLHYNYQCEINFPNEDDVWMSSKLDNSDIYHLIEDFNNSLGLRQIRTPFLDKQDIESLGWEYIITLDFSSSLNEDKREFYRIPLKDENLKGFYWELLPDYQTRVLGIWLCSEIQKNGNRSFLGKCLSINELKKMMKYLNIPINGNK